MHIFKECNPDKGFKNSNSRILKANLSWSPTWAKFYQLISSLSVVLPQLNLTKLKLEYLKFGFQYNNERYKHRQKIFASLEFELLSSSA